MPGEKMIGLSILVDRRFHRVCDTPGEQQRHGGGEHEQDSYRSDMQRH